MIKNLIISVETIILLGLIAFLYSTIYPHNQMKVFRFPEIKLSADERIVQAQMIFQNAHIKSIRKIPPVWYVDIDLDTPPNPIFNGSIIDGAAALESIKKLPEFEVDIYNEKMEPKAVKAIFWVSDYSGKLSKERRIEIELNKP